MRLLKKNMTSSKSSPGQNVIKAFVILLPLSQVLICNFAVSLSHHPIIQSHPSRTICAKVPFHLLGRAHTKPVKQETNRFKDGGFEVWMPLLVSKLIFGEWLQLSVSERSCSPAKCPQRQRIHSKKAVPMSNKWCSSCPVPHFEAQESSKIYETLWNIPLTIPAWGRAPTGIDFTDTEPWPIQREASEIRTKKECRKAAPSLPSLETPHRHPRHPATTRAHSDVLTQQAPKKALHLEPLVQPTRRTEHERYPGIIRYPHPSCVSTRDRFALESRNAMNYLNLWMCQFHEEKNTQIERGIPLAPFGQGAEATILRQSNSSATNVLLNFVLRFASCFLGFYQFCKRESDRFEHHLPFYRRSKVLKSIGNFRPWYSSQKPIGTLAVLPSRSL